MHEAGLGGPLLYACVQFGGSFTIRERQGVVQCWTERQECGHYLSCGGARSL